MISERQFTDALTFVRAYKDALEATEQIAERRAAYSHYEGLTRTLTSAAESGQLRVENGGQFLPGAAVAEFPLVKAHAFAKGLWTQYGLQSISSGDEFNSKLDKAIKELGAKVAKQ